ncbi:uncharacterized protein METZ01_LOCUS201483 [marine metagenome]|uniref:Uncharacterized protein n=1 Tax=marine metagenome TaxID=408172 RepID=A0A382EE06_9ZZZZ
MLGNSIINIRDKMNKVFAGVGKPLKYFKSV